MRSSPLLSIVITAAIAVPSAAFVLERTVNGGGGHEMQLASSTGAISITNSHEGQAILTAAPMLPGTTTDGTVKIVNSGSGPETMSLDAETPVDQPGPGGGRLSDRLTLRVEDLGADGSTTTVFSGAITALHQLALGTWAANESHLYRFVVRFPDGGDNGADNAYQGSAASIGFDWTAGDASGTTTPDPSAPYSEQVTADGPLGFWPLDGSPVDTLGHHDGTYANGITVADGAAPGGGTAAFFDGRAAYVYVNGITAPADAYTLEAWIKASDGGDGVIVEQGGAGALAIRSGKIAFRHVDTVITSSVAVTPGVWQDVVGTWSAATQTARLYVDGVQVAQGQATTIPSGASTFFMGRGNWPADPGVDGDSAFFAGAMAEVAYYGSVLTPSRVQAHYASGRVPVTAPATPPADQTPTPPDQGTPTPPPDSTGPSSTGPPKAIHVKGCPVKVSRPKPLPRHATAKQRAKARAGARRRAKRIAAARRRCNTLIRAAQAQAAAARTEPAG